MRLPTKADLRRFCEVDSWVFQLSTHHDRYTKRLETGEILRTRISRGTQELGNKDVWKHIFRDQLRVTEQEFWAAVDQGIPPDRGAAADAGEPPDEGIPGWLVEQLIRTVGLRPDEIGAMTSDEAHDAWLDYCSRPKPPNV